MDKIEDASLVVKKSVRKKPVKAKESQEEDYKTAVIDLSREQAIERFMRLRAEEKRRKLLEEVKDVGLLLS